MRTFLIFILIIFLLGITEISHVESQTSIKPLRIGVIFDGPWDHNQELFELLKREISDALIGQANVIFPAENYFEGNWTVAGTKKLNDFLLSDSNIDLIIGFGVFTSQDLCHRGPLPKPVIAPIIIDPQAQNIPFEAGISGVKNLSYLTFPRPIQRDLKLFQELIPFKKLAFLISKRYHEGIPPTLPSDEQLSKMLDVKVKTIYFDNIADSALKALPKECDAVYLDLVPLPQTEFDKLVKGFIERRLPSFSYIGESEVRRGIMAAANPDIFPRLIRRIALNLQRIILGEEPGSLAVNFPAGKRLFFNIATANAIGVYPKWSTLLEAELIQVEAKEPSALHLTLGNVMQRIINENLDVRAKVREINADAENIAIARANLLPRIDLNTTGFQIDKDRASAGYQPQRSASAGVDVTQVIFSEPALANLSIQSSLHDSKLNELELTRLDNLVEGAKTFLNYLRAKEIYYILLDNLKITHSNLELAQIRQSTGVAGQEETLRWEIEIANVRKAVMTLHSQMNQARYVLNQVLNIPLSQPLDVEDVSLDDPNMFLSNKKLLSYLEDPISFAVLTEYMVKEGIERSHELQQLDAIISAQNRALRSTHYSYFLPTVSAFANFANTYYKSAQATPLQPSYIPAPPEGLDPKVPLYLGQLFSAVSPGLPDRNDWNVGIQLSFNLFNGLSTRASEQKTIQQIEQYRIQHQALAEKISLRIRTDMENAKASYFVIQQTRLELEAAHKALELVTEAYTRGAISILSLLDAQNSLLRANQVATNALYDFLIEYFQLQRSLGQFDLLMSAQQREEFLNNLIQFMENTLNR